MMEESFLLRQNTKDSLEVLCWLGIAVEQINTWEKVEDGDLCSDSHNVLVGFLLKKTLQELSVAE